MCQEKHTARSKARHGAGLSGARAEHLKLLLSDADGLELLTQAASALAHARAPPLPNWLADYRRRVHRPHVPCRKLIGARRGPVRSGGGLAIGRMVALSKPAGGVRALVMGDVFRRRVSRTCARRLSWSAPHSSMRCRRWRACDLRVATESEPCTTVLSVDGVGECDHISRAAVFEGLRRDERLESLIPYLRLFYGSQSTYLF